MGNLYCVGARGGGILGGSAVGYMVNPLERLGLPFTEAFSSM